jgi:hypothetical protein
MHAANAVQFKNGDGFEIYVVKPSAVKGKKFEN